MKQQRMKQHKTKFKEAIILEKNKARRKYRDDLVHKNRIYFLEKMDMDKLDLTEPKQERHSSKHLTEPTSIAKISVKDLIKMYQK